MNDQTIPADEVRKIIAFYRDGASDRGGMILDALRALLPSPPRPTLADMPPEEWVACQWMQCDVKDDAPAVLLRVGGMYAHLVDKAGMPFKANHADVTPRPDLPRLTWPGDTPALPEGWRLADHPEHGRVVVTNPIPTSDGRVYYAMPSPGILGRNGSSCAPGKLTYLDGPESPTPARVGDTIESADPRIDSLPAGSVLCDLDGDDMEKTATGEWRDADGITIESPGCGPWTVHRIGNGADQ